MPEALKPCPFCGSDYASVGEPKLDPDSYETTISVRCWECDAFVTHEFLRGGMYTQKRTLNKRAIKAETATAISKWNTRSENEELTRLREEVKGLRARRIAFSSEDEGYIATNELMPGCSAFGDTPNEALTEMNDAEAAWLHAYRNANGKDFSSRALLKKEG